MTWEEVLLDACSDNDVVVKNVLDGKLYRLTQFVNVRGGRLGFHGGFQDVPVTARR